VRTLSTGSMTSVILGPRPAYAPSSAWRPWWRAQTSPCPRCPATRGSDGSCSRRWPASPSSTSCPVGPTGTPWPLKPTTGMTLGSSRGLLARDSRSKRPSCSAARSCLPTTQDATDPADGRRCFMSARSQAGSGVWPDAVRLSTLQAEFQVGARCCFVVRRSRPRGCGSDNCCTRLSGRFGRSARAVPLD
jgi:hypothetical protein